MRYGLIGSMKVQPGHRDALAATLAGGADALRAAGCEVYAVTVAVDDDVTIWVTEVWVSKQHHDDSLKLPEVQAAVAQARPVLTGEFFSQEVAVVGGLGV